MPNYFSKTWFDHVTFYSPELSSACRSRHSSCNLYLIHATCQTGLSFWNILHVFSHPRFCSRCSVSWTIISSLMVGTLFYLLYYPQHLEQYLTYGSYLIDIYRKNEWKISESLSVLSIFYDRSQILMLLLSGSFFWSSVYFCLSINTSVR